MNPRIGSLVVACMLPLCVAGCLARKQAMLSDGAPWPVSSQGQLVEGVAVVMVLVDKKGEPVAACVDVSSGNRELDRDALYRSHTRHYTPSMKDGVPVMSWARLPVAYSLRGFNDVDPDAAMARTTHCANRLFTAHVKKGEKVAPPPKPTRAGHR